MRYIPDNRGKCPHCLTVVRFEEVRVNGSSGLCRLAVSDFEQTPKHKPYIVYLSKCPNCGKFILSMCSAVEVASKNNPYRDQDDFVLLRPNASDRPVPTEVPEIIAQDYAEAALVLPISSKASAALSRRCLQNVLTEAGKSTKKNLAEQIAEVLPKLPSHLGEQIDAIRTIGNFAAHPIKSQASGSIVEVEPGEAEWNLDVLDLLFDYYYVQPEIARKKRENLDKKLQEAGKPPIQQP